MHDKPILMHDKVTLCIIIPILMHDKLIFMHDNFILMHDKLILIVCMIKLHMHDKTYPDA